MAMLSWSKIYDIPLDGVLVPGAMRTFEAVARSCIERITELLTAARKSRRRCSTNSSRSIRQLRAVAGIMENNSPGQKPAGAPVFIAQGTADELVRPQITLQFADRLCKAGAVVEMKMARGCVTFLCRI